MSGTAFLPDISEAGSTWRHRAEKSLDDSASKVGYGPQVNSEGESSGNVAQVARSGFGFG